MEGDILKSFFSEKYSFETNKEQDKTEINERLLINLKQIQMLFTQVQDQKISIKTKKNIQNYLSKESREMG